jgi:bleomycin hydrolase
MVKNSWGTDSNDLGGILYVSTSYFNYKTTSILVHKKAIPADIAKKLNIK